MAQWLTNPTRNNASLSRPAAIALIRPLAWQAPCAVGAAVEMTKGQKNTKKIKSPEKTQPLRNLKTSERSEELKVKSDVLHCTKYHISQTRISKVSTSDTLASWKHFCRLLCPLWVKWEVHDLTIREWLGHEEESP